MGNRQQTIEQNFYLADTKRYVQTKQNYKYKFLTWYDGCSSWTVFNRSEYKQHSSGFQIYNIWSLYAIRFRTVFEPLVSNIFLIAWNMSSLFKFSMSVMEGISRARVRTYSGKKNNFRMKWIRKKTEICNFMNFIT